MTTPPYLSVARLIWRRFMTGPLSSILVAVLVLITAFVAAVAPRLVERQTTAELTYQLTSIGPVARSLGASGDFLETWTTGPAPGRDLIYGEIDYSLNRTRQKLASPLREATGAAVWITQTPTLPTTLVNGKAHNLGLRLTADENYLSRVRFVAGTAPTEWSGNDSSLVVAPTDQPIDIALSSTAAHSLKVGVGDIIGTPDVDGVPQPRYRISGIYEPRHPAALYWAENPSLVPGFLVKPDRGGSFLAASAFVHPLSVGHLSGSFAVGRMSMYYPLKADAADGADAELLRTQIASLVSSGVSMPGDGATPLTVSTGSADAIETAIHRDAILAGFLALLASAPLGVTLAVLGLGVQAIVRARRGDVALVVARGAGGPAVRLAMALEGLILGVPGAVVVTALAAVLIPERPQLSGFVLPALVAVTPGILFAALGVPTDLTPERARVRNQLRLVSELAVVLLALLALFLLARRGLAQSTAAVGIDPLLVATPLLLSVSVGILVLRGYPLPLRAARRRATGSRGLAGFVGSLRATRAPTVGLVGVLALVVGISIATFSTIMLSTFDNATARSASDSVGADARADAPLFSSAQQAAVRSVSGVSAVSAIEHLDARSVRAKGIVDTVNVLIGQTDQLRALRPGLAPGLTTKSDGRIPVVVSADLVSELAGHAGLTLDGVPVRVAGELPSDSRLGPQRSWILVDAEFVTPFTPVFRPDLLLVRAHPQQLSGLASRVARAAGPDATVQTVESVTAERRSEPAVAGVRDALVVGAAISVLLCAIALVLSTIVAGRARARTAGILRTLGLPSRSLRVLVAWELVPVVVVAVIAGTALGVALPFILTAAIDLRPFAGGTARPVPLLDPASVGFVLAAFCAVVALVGVAAVAAGERLNPSTSLKMGDQ